MEIVPLAYDSLGTRSMATYIATSDCKILIDPGVALAPTRYGYPPHRIELERAEQHWQSIEEYSKKADILIVTHYHYDHHNPEQPEIYKDKTVFLKHPTKNINRSQRIRAEYFIKNLRNLPKSVEFSDCKKFKFKNTTIKFSKPVPHGTDTKLGWVTEVCIDTDDTKFVHTSDVEGCTVDEQMDFLIEESPDIVFCDGPMTYMLGYRYSYESLKKCIENFKKLIQTTTVMKIVFDHHFLRDINWREKIKPILKTASTKKVVIHTAASFIGQKNDLLEARRPELYKTVM